MDEKMYNEYRLELLRDRNRIEADISRNLWRLLTLLESIVQHTPWAMQIMSGVYKAEAERENRIKNG